MPRFVVQHHLATADHYDFRLELGGVLVSWAVPKGPSLDPSVRRMAKRVGDHDLDHAGYEGVLSTQRRGGGVVQVWDQGTWRNATRRQGVEVAGADALTDGHLTFELHGTKLRGGFSMIKTRGDADDLWLLLKKRDEYGDPHAAVTEDDRSVLTGRTLAEIEADG